MDNNGGPWRAKATSREVNLRVTSIKEIIDDVKAAGAMALKAQRRMQFSDRAYKSDGSVVTEADKEVEEYLCGCITARYPEANLITEEGKHNVDPDGAYTFAIDPIDGTDVFSQGMPGWCVSVGLLDDRLAPAAGIIFAPRLDLLIVAGTEGPVTLNGAELPSPSSSAPISVKSNLMVTSRIHKQLDLSGYVGKIRSIGSAALHLCFPLIYPPVVGALEGPGAHIWDIAGAHAIVRAQGQDLVYLNEEPLDYATMLDGGPADDIIMSGSRLCIAALREMVRRLD
jgi:myo-inositol-1(or 4)-monophosphatase